MIIKKSLQDRLRLLVLLLAALSLMALAGCGSDAQYGSSITVEQIAAYTPNPLPSTQTEKYVAYRVSVVDPAGLPLNGVEVDVHAQFTSGSNVNVNGSIGSAPVIMSSKLEMYGWGYRDFTISAPTLTLRQISAPTTVDATPRSGSGFLGNGSYNFAITAIDAAGGQTTPSITASAILSDGTTTQGVGVSWSSVTGATAYNVYGNNGAGGPMLLASRVTGTTYVYGSIAGGAGLPGANTTGIAANSVNGTLTFTTGAARATQVVAF